VEHCARLEAAYLCDDTDSSATPANPHPPEGHAYTRMHTQAHQPSVTPLTPHPLFSTQILKQQGSADGHIHARARAHTYVYSPCLCPMRTRPQLRRSTRRLRPNLRSRCPRRHASVRMVHMCMRAFRRAHAVFVRYAKYARCTCTVGAALVYSHHSRSRGRTLR
jgi:hypothetical protein